MTDDIPQVIAITKAGKGGKGGREAARQTGGQACSKESPERRMESGATKIPAGRIVLSRASQSSTRICIAASRTARLRCALLVMPRRGAALLYDS